MPKTIAQASPVEDLISQFHDGELDPTEFMAKALHFVQNPSKLRKAGPPAKVKKASKDASEDEDEDDTGAAADAGDAEDEDGDEDAAGQADEAGDGDEEDEEDEEPVPPARVKKSAARIRKAAAEAEVEDEPDFGDLGQLQEGFMDDPDMAAAYDASPALQEIAERDAEIAKAINYQTEVIEANTAALQSLASSLKPIAKAIRAQFLPERPAKVEKAVDAVSTKFRSTGDPVQDNLLKSAIDGLRALQARVDAQDEVINRRPYSPHANGNGVGILKSGAGVTSSVTKKQVVGILQKSLAAQEITENEAQEAAHMLDVVEREGQGYDVAVKESAPGAFPALQALMGGK